MSSPFVIPIILSGGSGSRLWPLSRTHYPKQFIPLASENTMLQETVIRLSGVSCIKEPIVVCNEEHRFLVAEQMQSIKQSTNAIILEPIGRNTAPTLAIAALKAMGNDKNPVLLVLPADHVIQNVTKFQEAIGWGVDLAKKGKLVTFGIVPYAPETGYGYIEMGQKILSSPSSAFQIQQFVEKPDIKTAQTYIEDGKYLWNSGMFIFQAQQYLNELEKHQPEIIQACKDSLSLANNDLDFIRLHKESFELSPSNSIDYAVMEKTQNGVVIPLDAGWNDVGSWSSLWEIGNKDSGGNVRVGETLEIDTTNSYLYSSGRLLATVGLDEVIVIETADAVLVANKNRTQDIKEIVNQLQEKGGQKLVSHRKIFRPWGNYDCIDKGDRFQAKKITVNPGASLSLQMHYHRAEHWVVVKGTAKITKGDEVVLLGEDQSTYIPFGIPHRLENPGSIPLEIIEVQSGSYLGEDDIVRIDDIYGRK